MSLGHLLRKTQVQISLRRKKKTCINLESNTIQNATTQLKTKLFILKLGRSLSLVFQYLGKSLKDED